MSNLSVIFKKKITLIALIGGVLVVLLAMPVVCVIWANMYVNMQANKAQEQTFTVYQFTASVEAGRPLNKDSLKPIQVPKRFENSLGDIVREAECAGLLTEAPKLRRDAAVGRLLTYDFFFPISKRKDSRQAAPLPESFDQKPN